MRPASFDAEPDYRPCDFIQWVADQNDYDLLDELADEPEEVRSYVLRASGMGRATLGADGSRADHGKGGNAPEQDAPPLGSPSGAEVSGSTPCAGSSSVWPAPLDLAAVRDGKNETGRDAFGSSPFPLRVPSVSSERSLG